MFCDPAGVRSTHSLLSLGHDPSGVTEHRNCDPPDGRPKIRSCIMTSMFCDPAGVRSTHSLLGLGHDPSGVRSTHSLLSLGHDPSEVTEHRNCDPPDGGSKDPLWHYDFYAL